jgi:opacity protein-like surface antigen
LGGIVAGNFVVPDDQNPFGGDRSKWEPGYTAGAGVECRINPNWSVRFEYRFMHFNVDRSLSSPASSNQTSTSTTSATVFNFNNSFSQDTSSRVNLHLGLVSIVYRFKAA